MDVKYSWGMRVDQRNEGIPPLTLNLSGSWFIFGPCFSQYHHSSFYLMLNPQYHFLPLSFSLRLIVTSFAGIWVLFWYPVWNSVLLSPTSHSLYRLPSLSSASELSLCARVIVSSRHHHFWGLFLTSTNLSPLECYICVIIFSKCLDWFVLHIQ